MAEEVKETQEKRKSSEVFKTFLKMALGVILVIIGGVLIWKWWPSVWTVIKGCLGPFLILVGIIIIAIAKE